MNKMKRLSSLLAASLLATLPAGSAMAAAGIGIPASITIVPGLTIGSTTPLAAGSISKPANSSTTDYLTVGIAEGCVPDISAGASLSILGTPTLGSATITGTPNAAITVTTNSNSSTKNLAGPSAMAMEIDLLEACLDAGTPVDAGVNLTGTIGAGGSSTLKIGGKFKITGTHLDGTYSGFIMVMVEYE